jgi:hypothetical protein
MATGTYAPRVGLSGRQCAAQGYTCGQGKCDQRHPLDFSIAHLSSPLSLPITLGDKQTTGRRH